MLDTLDPRFLLSIFLRRFPIFLMTAVLIFSGFAAAAVLLPATYTSRAQILVESQQIPSDLVQSTVSSMAQERLRIIQQRLMTRENLLDIANEYDIFDDRPDMSPTEIVSAMRRSTRFRARRLGGRSALSFTVAFSASNPRVAARVASAYTTRILEDNLKMRTGLAADTYEFFQQESERLAGELTAIETEIVEFKRSNRDTLPETLGFRNSSLDRVQQRQQLKDRELADLQQKRKTLLEMQQTPEQLLQTKRERTQAERQRRQLLARRDLRTAILSEQHPEIRALDTRILALDRVIEKEREAREVTSGPRFEAAVSRQLDRVNTEIELTEQRLAQLEDELSGLERRESELERSIAETPNTQMALNSLQRNYANLQRQYENARSKLAVSATGEQLELKQQAERFEVIEQPQVPANPDKPDRFMILVMGLGGGAGGGLGLIVLLEILNRAVRRPADVISAIDQQPLAVIPYIYTDQELKRRVRVKWTLIIGSISLVVALLALTHIYYLPLDLIATQMMEKTEIDAVLELIRNRLDL
ncbi:MAG: hypothetical protein AAF192_09865 [Pseudomonadota bacterium]